MEEPIVQLSALNDSTSPLEKIYALQETCNLISSCVLKSLKSSSPTTTPNLSDTFPTVNIGNDYPQQSTLVKEVAPITTDDLIPILSYILIQAKPKHLHSNLLYMENFSFTNISKTSLGYFFYFFF